MNVQRERIRALMQATPKQRAYIRALLIELGHAHHMGSLRASSKYLPYGPSMRERGKGSDGIDNWTARSQTSIQSHRTPSRRRKERSMDPAPPHWPSFSHLKSLMDSTTSMTQAQNILREAKMQIQSGTLQRGHLQSLRDTFHWRKNNGKFRSTHGPWLERKHL